ncbi:MAG: zinc-ribbon domain-containing protein [Oscillospiraceae bacterium]|nr:zinc-ribbon domain-containing protein [Oscillospiraceae bacterium]
MLCQQCGFQLPENSKFCHKCGSAMANNAQQAEQAQPLPQPQPQPQQQIQQQPENAPVVGENKSKIGIILGIVGSVIAVGGIIFVLFITTCRYDSCFGRKIIGGYYCSKHACIDPDCTNGGYSHWYKDVPIYCGIHLCFADENCLERSLDGGSFCLDHTCIELGCLERSNLELNGRRYKNYCITHTCRKSDCTQRRFDGSGSCEIHVCKEPDCLSDSSYEIGDRYYENYCITHTCHKTDCTQRKFDGSLWCEKHTCKEFDCFYETLSNSEYCLLHN